MVLFFFLRDVQFRVDLRRNRLDGGIKFLFNTEDVVTIVIGNKVDSQTKVTETTRAANTVKIGFSGLGEIEVDDDVDGLDVDTTSDKIGTDQVTAVTLTEVVEDAVTVLLLHAGVDVVARVTELGDLAGEEFDTVDGVAEDDGLVDLELVEEGVEAVDLLAFFDEGVELGDTLQGKLVHKVDLVGLLHVSGGEVLDGEGEGRREEKGLAALERRDIAIDLIHEFSKLR